MPPRKTAATKNESKNQAVEGQSLSEDIQDDVSQYTPAFAESTIEIDPEPEPTPEPEPEATPEVKEALTLEDLVFDHGKVKARLNLFPVTIDGVREQRLFIVEVPGEEEGTLAALWYRSTQAGPELVYPIRRVSALSQGIFTLEDNSDHTFEKDSGCGCGNLLKGWNGPWGGYVRIVQTRAARL